MKRVLLIVAGIASIGMSVVCFNKDTGTYVGWQFYGGDAYTGIQHASADTGQNVKDLAEICRFGFGSVLLVGGIALVASGIPERKKKVTDTVEKETTTLS